MFNIETLRSKSVSELHKIVQDLGIKVAKNSDQNTIIFAILDFQASNTKAAKEYYTATEISGTENGENAAAEPATPKKRGRKKKTEMPEAAENAADTVGEISTEPGDEAESNTEAMPQKKKPVQRGRKQKTPQTDTEETVEITVQETAPKTELTAQNQSPHPNQNSNPNQSPNNQHRSNSGNNANIGNRNQQQANQSQPQNANQNANQNKNQHQNRNQHRNQENQEGAEAKKEFNFDGLVTIEGVLEILPDNYGFLRSSDFSYISSPDDVYVSTAQIRNYGLKTGDTVKGIVRLPKEGEKYFSLQKPLEVNGRDLDFIKDRVAFEYLTPLFPEEKFNLAGKGSTHSTRIVDMFAPIGKGQRAMIVAQPKTGKTMLLKDIANAISANHPEAYMMVLLIDERPEEVTDMERSVNAEVIASTFDEAAEKHVKVANLVLAKAQRLVECGHDVVILLDSITRLARAYNTVTPASGKVLSGGVDANALHRPKRFFGAARNIEGGGSLTIIATALIDTGSKMDEVIFEEFKGTGNMELQLDRKIANKRVFPAIDLVASSTRKDDLLLDTATSQRMWIMRKYLSDMNPVEAMEFVEKNIKGTLSNEEFLMSMNR